MVELFRWTAAACACGVVLGIGGRFVMRLIAVASGLSPAFSFGGSGEVVLTGIAIGFPYSIVFWLLRRRISRGAHWPGLLGGGLLFVLLSLLRPPAARSALAATPDPELLTAALFAALFLGYGLMTELVWTRWLSRASRVRAP